MLPSRRTISCFSAGFFSARAIVTSAAARSPFDSASMIALFTSSDCSEA